MNNPWLTGTFLSNEQKEVFNLAQAPMGELHAWFKRDGSRLVIGLKELKVDTVTYVGQWSYQEIAEAIYLLKILNTKINE